MKPLVLANVTTTCAVRTSAATNVELKYPGGTQTTQHTDMHAACCIHTQTTQTSMLTGQQDLGTVAGVQARSLKPGGNSQKPS